MEGVRGEEASLDGQSWETLSAEEDAPQIMFLTFYFVLGYS